MRSKFFLITIVFLALTTSTYGLDDYSSRLHDKRAYIKFCHELMPIDDALENKYDIFMNDLEANKLPKNDETAIKYIHDFKILYDKIYDIEVPELSNIFVRGSLQKTKNLLLKGYQRRFFIMGNYVYKNITLKKQPPGDILTKSMIFGDNNEDQLANADTGLFDAGLKLGFDAKELFKILKYPTGKN